MTLPRLVYISAPYSHLNDGQRRGIFWAIDELSKELYTRFGRLAPIHVLVPIKTVCPAIQKTGQFIMYDAQQSMESHDWLLSDLYLMRSADLFVYLWAGDMSAGSAGMLTEFAYMCSMSYVRPIEYAVVSYAFDDRGNVVLSDADDDCWSRMCDSVIRNGKTDIHRIFLFQ